MAIFWVARDKRYRKSDYVIAKRKKDLYWCSEDSWWRGGRDIPARWFERITGIKLQPGEGPVKIKIERID